MTIPFSSGCLVVCPLFNVCHFVISSGCREYTQGNFMQLWLQFGIIHPLVSILTAWPILMSLYERHSYSDIGCISRILI